MSAVCRAQLEARYTGKKTTDVVIDSHIRGCASVSVFCVRCMCVARLYMNIRLRFYGFWLFVHLHCISRVSIADLGAKQQQQHKR